MDTSPILVVGGRTGIGAAVAEWFPERAVVWSRSTGVDATDPESVARGTEQLIAARGTPWAVVHTVGDFDEESLLETSDAHYRHMVESNLTTAFVVLRALTPHLVAAERGRIVLFGAAGVSDATAKSRSPVYFAVKAAVVSLARSLARDVAASGVTVNVVSPGIIRHPDSHATSQDRMQVLVPAGRAGTVDDCRSTIEWLLSPASGYVTGEEIVVDGGLRLGADPRW